MKSNWLQLNSDKTQFMWLGSRQQIDTKTITIDEHSILHRIFDFRQQSRRDIRQWTGNGPACQQHHSQLFLSVETTEIHPTLTLHGCRENNGLFPHIKSCRLLQQYLSRCHRHCREKTAICPQRRSQVDLDQEEVRPYHSCAEGSAPLASHPSAHRLQDCSLCLQRPSWSWSDIPHLQSCPRGRRQGSPAICYSRRPDCASNQDSLLWAQKLPCFGTGRLELTARGHSNSGTVAGMLQIYVENTFISPCICLAVLTALCDLVKECLISVSYIYIYTGYG